MSNKGRLVEYQSNDDSTKKGIVYDKHQVDILTESGRVLVSKTDDDYKLLDEPKIMKIISKLKVIGFVD